MPRKSPLPPEEVEICERVKSLRTEKKWSRITFASEVGIDVYTLAAIEHHRSPVSYGVARKLLNNWATNPRWLAEGKGRQHDAADLSDPKDLGVADHTRFSTVYNSKLKDSIVAQIRSGESPEALRLEELTGVPEIEFGTHFRLEAEARLIALLREWIALIPDSKVSRFSSELRRAGEALANFYTLEPTETVHNRREALKAARPLFDIIHPKAETKNLSSLTITDKSVISILVNPTESLVQELIEEVKAATAERGSRTRLAREVLGVSPQRLNDWLSGEHEPSAEVALKLWIWVYSHHLQDNKAQGRVISTPKGQKTQSRQTRSNENRKSGPRKPT